MIEGGKIYIKRNKLPWRIIEDEAVIVDLDRNAVLQLNETARVIWEAIDGNNSVDRIAYNLTEQYDIDSANAYKDTVGFINNLAERGLIYEISAEA